MVALIHPQLPLGFEPGELFTFDSFVVGNNAVAAGLAQQLADRQKRLEHRRARGLSVQGNVLPVERRKDTSIDKP